MKVALYHPWIYVKSGLERTIMEIFRGSRHEWTLFTSHYDAEATYPELREMGVREINPVSVERRYGAVISGAARIAGTRLPLEDHDALVVCCDGIGSFITLRNHDLPVICLCFTPLRAVYDEAYRERHLGRQGLFGLLARMIELGYRAIDRLLWRNYDHVIAISGVVKSRISRGGLAAGDSIEVLYPGINAGAAHAGEANEPYFLLPGRIMWTKNIELGIEAFRQFAGTGQRGYRLVIAGMVDNKSLPYLERLRELAGDEAGIEFRTDLSDAQMRELYERCYAVLFTAFNEDLGLTPLEAGSHGKPVIAVDRGGPRETVVHEHTGLLAPAEAPAFAGAMARLANDTTLASTLGTAGLAHCRDFDWSHFVEGLDTRIDALVAGPRRDSDG